MPGISTAADVPGTCHNSQDYFDSELASAELTPAVPCTAPHTSETVWTAQLTGILARQHDRPTPEMLSGQYRDVCQDPKRLSRYLGQNSTGFLYNLSVTPKYPAAPEWRAGLRTVRCAASMWFPGPARVRWRFPLRGSWALSASAGIRLCANGTSAYVPCDQPHVEEVLLPVSAFPATQRTFPDPQTSRRVGRVPCTRAALDLLGTKSLPAGLRVVVEPAEQQNWAHSHDVGCRIASAKRTGTLQGGLT